MIEEKERADSPPAGQAPLPERARDLTLLALGIIVINEAVLTAQIVVSGEENVLVAQAGRLAVKAGLAYMTWQGFGWPRWMLALLAAVAALTGPWALAHAWRDGATPWSLLLTVIVAGYFVATWLLVGSRTVSRFLAHRRELRDRETS
jgi:hypothetical protein